jgi:RNA polymerase-binding transcription factor DksA
MTKTELEHYRKTLLALRNRITGDVTHLTDEALRSSADGEANLSHVPIHMADLGTDSFEHDNTLSLLEVQTHNLEEIDRALERIDRGTFGTCEECHAVIQPKERLRELPYTRLCLNCARKLESEGR